MAETVNSANSVNVETRVLDIVSLYPKDMNIYGDTGNVKTVEMRARLYGYEPRIHAYNVGDAWPEHVDLVLGGGGQDKGKAVISDDLFARRYYSRARCRWRADAVNLRTVSAVWRVFRNA